MASLESVRKGYYHLYSVFPSSHCYLQNLSSDHYLSPWLWNSLTSFQISTSQFSTELQGIFAKFVTSLLWLKFFYDFSSYMTFQTSDLGSETPCLAIVILWSHLVTSTIYSLCQSHCGLFAYILLIILISFPLKSFAHVFSS